MEIKLRENLEVIVLDNEGCIAHRFTPQLADFRADEWHEFEHKGKEYELNTLDNGDSLIVHLYPYGETYDAKFIIDGDHINDPEPRKNK